MMSISTDTSNVISALELLEARIDTETNRGLKDVADECLRLSQAEVPHDEGTLQNSGVVEDFGKGRIVLGYHTVYAAKLHEHPEYNFQKGRKGRYLEDPIMENRAVLASEFTSRMQMRLFK